MKHENLSGNKKSEKSKKAKDPVKASIPNSKEDLKKDLKFMNNNPKSIDTMKDNSNTEIKDPQEPANLTIHSIFVKDISYEAPSTPQAFSLAWEPQVKFDIQVMRRAMDQVGGLHEVVLHTTISTKLKVKNTDTNVTAEDQELVAFLIDVKLAGMFTVKGLPEAQLDRVLSTTAPTILFPYVAETIASLVTRGGFPQFILPPIDFATLYQQRLDNKDPQEKSSDQDKNSGVTVN